jgi:hypothetical protein
MELAIELPAAQAARLRQEAARLGIPPADLARAAVADLLGTKDDDFRAAAARVVKKNDELSGEGSQPPNDDVFRVGQILAWLANSLGQWGARLKRRRHVQELPAPLGRAATGPTASAEPDSLQSRQPE